MEMIGTGVVLVLAGLLIGVFSGMLGIGGGTLMVPTLRLLFGFSPLMSTATSLFAIIPTSLSGAVSHIRNKTIYIGLGVAIGLGGACASPLGVYLATLSPGWMVMTGTALVITYSAISMFTKAIRYKPDTGGRSQAFEGNRSFTHRQLGGGFFLGLLAGVVSGFVGVGGGFIIVPILITLFHVPMKQASGTSLIAVLLLAIPGVITQGLFGNIHYMAGIALALGTIPGAYYGAKLVNRVSERSLRFIFGGFLLVAATLLVVNEFTG